MERHREEQVNRVTDAILNDDRLKSVGPGWASLLIPILVKADEMGAHVEQIKEKFGGLRVYVRGGDRELWDMIDAAGAKSFTMCEECGKPAKPTDTGWIRTLCEEHAKKNHA